MSGRSLEVNIVMRCAPEEAVDLMLHHLGLAAAYFANTPEDGNALAILESKRLFEEGSIEFRATVAWLDTILLEYLKLARDVEE